jgi:hypothetical protein
VYAGACADVHSGLMVPMVNTAEEARFIVSASKFPPLGIRGQGSPFSSWSSSLVTPEYVQRANESLLTIVQIETLQAVQNVDAIAAVDGVGESPAAAPHSILVVQGVSADSDAQTACSSAPMTLPWDSWATHPRNGPSQSTSP